jgi:hypothetical protein
MILEKLVAISGKSGLFSMVGNRSNGLIVEELDTQKRFFASSRMHQFTPLASISIYTEDEENTVELREVMLRMLVAMTNLPVEDANADSTKLRQYFSQIMPEHDRERVLISDIKKLIKWFQFLHAKGLITETNLQKPASTEVEEEA